MKRKIVALILCLCMCIISVNVEAKTKKTSGQEGANITWNYDKQTKFLTFSGSGPISNFEMDGHIDEPEWYDWSEQAEHIVVEEGITSIGEWAFQNFWVVKSVSLPETLKEIRGNAFFDNRELRTCNLPSNLEYIRAYAFFSCNKVELPSFPKKMKTIGEYAFCGCNKLKSFSFPNKVKKIANGILSECKYLSDIKLRKLIYLKVLKQ